MQESKVKWAVWWKAGCSSRAVGEARCRESKATRETHRRGKVQEQGEVSWANSHRVIPT